MIIKCYGCGDPAKLHHAIATNCVCFMLFYTNCIHAVLIPVCLTCVLINVNNSTAMFWVYFPWDFPASRVLISCCTIFSVLSAAAVYDNYNGIYIYTLGCASNIRCC